MSNWLKRSNTRAQDEKLQDQPADSFENRSSGWIWVGSSDAAWGSSIKKLVPDRTDSVADVWLNIETGCKVLLTTNGGWEAPEKSKFVAFYKSVTNDVTEVSLGLLSHLTTEYIASETGIDNYSPIHRTCRKAIEDFLMVSPDHRG